MAALFPSSPTGLSLLGVSKPCAGVDLVYFPFCVMQSLCAVQAGLAGVSNREVQHRARAPDMRLFWPQGTQETSHCGEKSPHKASGEEGGAQALRAGTQLVPAGDKELLAAQHEVAFG